jgi:hypothetical protein
MPRRSKKPIKVSDSMGFFIPLSSLFYRLLATTIPRPINPNTTNKARGKERVSPKPVTGNISGGVSSSSVASSVSAVSDVAATSSAA